MPQGPPYRTLSDTFIAPTLNGSSAPFVNSLYALMHILIYIGPAMALAGILLGGFYFMNVWHDDQAIEKGKRLIKWSIAILLIMAGSIALINALIAL